MGRGAARVGAGAPLTLKEAVHVDPQQNRGTVAVLQDPDDAEDGAEVLDTYVEDFAVLMGLDMSSQRLLRYHVLAPMLAWTTQNKNVFIHDWNEAADG